MLDLIFVVATITFFLTAITYVRGWRSYGEPRVNVLLLNLALDEQKPMSRQLVRP